MPATATETLAMAYQVLQNELQRELQRQQSPSAAHGLGGRADLGNMGGIADIIATLCKAQGELNTSEQEVNRRAEERMNQALREAE